MSTLFLHCSIQAPLFPGLPALLGELAGPKVIILPAEMAAAQPQLGELFDRVIPVPGNVLDFMDSARVELEAFRAHAETPFTRVTGTGELGVLRGARLREALGIPGQSVASAVAYRDKVTMKTFCVREGIRVARFKVVDGPADLLGFVRAVGLPIVLKPRAGAGSIDTRLLSTDDDVAAFLSTMRAATTGLGANLLAEEFIRGQLYHVNGYATSSGDIRLSWPASYVERGNLDSILNEGSVSGEYLLDYDDPRTPRLNAFAEKCLRALPWPTDGFAFHLEVFEEDGTGDLVFCEVACRQGGGNINDVYEQAFGVSLLEASLRLQAGLPVRPHSMAPIRCYGAIQAPVGKGTLHLSSDAAPPFPWVVRHELRIKAGEKATGPRSCVDSSANFLVHGESEREVRARLEEVTRWRASVATWVIEEERMEAGAR